MDHSTQKIRVLFADADAAFCVFARYSLEQFGVEVTLANDGADLIARFLPEHVDVVVVGLTTPFFDGLEVLHAIKQRHPATPVILLCDDEGSHLGKQGIQEGAFAYFQKPLNDFIQLRDAIRRADAQASHISSVVTPAPAPLPHALETDTLTTTLHRLIEATRTQPLSITLQMLSTAGAYLTQAPCGIVLLPHPTGFQVFGAHGLEDLEAAHRDLVARVGDSFIARVLTERQTISEPIEPTNHVLGVPLLTANQTLGALILYPIALPPGDSAQIAHLEILAAQGTLAIELAHLREENLRLVTTDLTSGVLKREPFLELADREFRRSWRYNQPITAIIVDIDDLSLINQRVGGPFGNQVLRAVANVCVGVIRSIDLIGRYDSDAFALLLLMTESEGAKSVTERLRAELNALHLADAPNTFQITVAMGVCSYPRHGCTSIFDLLAVAQEAQRAARYRGTNQIIYG